MMGRGSQCNVITGMNQLWGQAKSCTSCGKCVQVCPTGALFKKGSTVSEMEKQFEFLIWILDGRDKKIWHWAR
jgi:bidirectional [NiFe] hydrogenase diaphorase subunit